VLAGASAYRRQRVLGWIDAVVVVGLLLGSLTVLLLGR